MYTHNYISSDNSRHDIRNIYDNNNIFYEPNYLKRGNFPKKLYKYCSINEYSIHNLIKSELTMTCPTEFNDIFDSTMHTDFTKKTIEDIERLDSLYTQLGYGDFYTDELIEESIKISKKRSTHLLNYLIKDFYINSFTTDYRNILMWSHYADYNKGICIEYDFSESNQVIQDNLYKTVYVDRPIDVTDLLESNENDKVSLSILISIVSKFKEWKYENEWRIVCYSGGNSNTKEDKRLQLINIPKPKKIYVGNRFLQLYQNERKLKSEKFYNVEVFLNYIKDNEIPIKIAKRQKNSFELDFIDITVEEIIKNKHRKLSL